jgi:hypothetical protein
MPARGDGLEHEAEFWEALFGRYLSTSVLNREVRTGGVREEGRNGEIGR